MNFNLLNWFRSKQEYSITDNLLSEFRSSAGAKEIKVDENSALTMVALFACVRIIAETIASFPFPVYRRMDNGGRERDRENPVFDLLNISPDDEITAMQWREAMLAHTLTWGNGYSEIEFSRSGQPMAMHLLPPNKIKVERTKSGKIIYRIDNVATPIPAANMLHWAGLGFDGLIGYSPIKLGKSAIQLGMSTEMFGSSFFNNGSKPGGILVHPNKLSPQAVSNLTDSIEDKHGGPGNFGKWMVLQEGMSVEQIGIPPEDAQFLATRVFQIQEICRLYKVPCHLVNDLTAATFSNIIEQELEFVIHTLRPWCVRIEQQANMKLFSKADRKYIYAEHLVDALLRGNPKDRTEALKTQFLNGALTLPEWREIENRNPVDDPDEHFVPNNLTTLGNVQRAAAQSKSEANKPADQTIDQQPAEPVGEPADQSTESQTAQPSEAAVSASRDSVTDNLMRMCRREQQAVCRAAKNPKEFLNLIDEFYSKHQEIVEKAMIPSLKAFYALTDPDADVENNAVFMAEQICKDSKEQLLDLSGRVTTDMLPESINRWCIERSREILSMITI